MRVLIACVDGLCLLESVHARCECERARVKCAHCSLALARHHDDLCARCTHGNTQILARVSLVRRWYIHTHTLTLARALILTHSLTHAHTYTHTRTHSCTHAHTVAHTVTHTLRMSVQRTHKLTARTQRSYGQPDPNSVEAVHGACRKEGENNVSAVAGFKLCV